MGIFDKLNNKPSKKSKDKHTLENQTNAEETYREQVENHLGCDTEDAKCELVNKQKELDYLCENEETEQKIRIKFGKDETPEKPVRSLFDPDCYIVGWVDEYDETTGKEVYAGDFARDFSKDSRLNKWWKQAKKEIRTDECED